MTLRSTTSKTNKTGYPHRNLTLHPRTEKWYYLQDPEKVYGYMTTHVPTPSLTPFVVTYDQKERSQRKGWTMRRKELNDES